MIELQVKYSNMVLNDLNRLCVVAKETEPDTLLRGLFDKIANEAVYPKPRLPLCYEDGYTGYFSVTYEGCMVFYRVVDKILYVDRILSENNAVLKSLSQSRLLQKS